jgi:hypothetical protein
MTQILYFFITHQKNLLKTYHNKQKNLPYSIIVCGGSITEFNLQKRILYIKCNDLYEGLPEKIIKTLKYLVESPHFINYTHFVKLDENINIIRPLPNNIFNNINYAGKVQYYQGNRRWHFGKCSSNNKYYNIEYQGEFVPWCKGGYGYIISRTAINLIKDNQDFTNHIYEDLYLGLILREKNILPTPIKTELFFS